MYAQLLRSNMPYLHNIHSLSQLSVETFLYQIGVLTLRDVDVTYSLQQKVHLVVPNTCVRRDYAQEFLKSQTHKSPGTMSAFVAKPTAETLLSCLKSIRQNIKWTNERTETDIVILVGAELFLQSSSYAHPCSMRRFRLW